MKTENEFFRAERLLIMDATGLLDKESSLKALAKLAAHPNFSSTCEVLIDLRDIHCSMSASDIYSLAVAMAWPQPALPTNRKIAVLVEGRTEFDHASFLALCASDRGLSMAAFDDYDKAGQWLTATLPLDAKDPDAGRDGSEPPSGGVGSRSPEGALPLVSSTRP